MPDTSDHKRLLEGLRNVVAAIDNCPNTLNHAACQASLRSNFQVIRRAMTTQGAAAPPLTAKQLKRLAAALMSMLTALVEERHPCDDAWQTATFATLGLLDDCLTTHPALADQFETPAGRMALESVLQRLSHDRQGEALSLGAHGFGVITLVARIVLLICQRLRASDPAGAAVSFVAELVQMLIALVVQLFAPPHRTAGDACTCPGPSPTASAAVRVRADAMADNASDVYGATVTKMRPINTVYVVTGLCKFVAARCPETHGPLVRAGWRCLSSLYLAMLVYAERQCGHPRAFAGAGAPDLTRFVHPAFLTPAVCVVVPFGDMPIASAALALQPRHAPDCAQCLPDQLMLVLEAAGLLDDPGDAEQCYSLLGGTLMMGLGRQGTAADGPLRDFWRRAWPRLGARALEAARTAGQTAEGSAGAAPHVALLQTLRVTLLMCVMHGCQPADEGAALDAICEAAARTRPPLMYAPACSFFKLRLQCILSPMGAPPRPTTRDGSPPPTLAAAIVSMGKLLQFHGEVGDVARSSAFRFDFFSHDDQSAQLIAQVVYAVSGDGSEPPPALNFAPAPAADEGPQPWVELAVLVAARVKGAVAQRILLAGGEAMLPADAFQDVTESAAQLVQHPRLWDAVQRATHGRVAPFNGSPSPESSGQPTAEALRAEGGAAGAVQHDDTVNRGSLSGEGTSSVIRGSSASACADALRFLAELHDWLDPHALGVRLPGCYNPRCTNLRGASEAELPVRMCSGCRVARYCSAACSKQHWRCHKVACRAAATSGQA